MPLSELTSRDAILSAIHEYDTLGQEAFLQKYGYGRSREYLLEYDGKSYDSKAIVGAAYGIQHPTEGPLKHNDFSGGLARIEPVLQRLGFRLSKLEPMETQQSIKFEFEDFSLFSRYPTSRPFGDVPEPDKVLFQTIRQRLKNIAEATTQSFPAQLEMKAHASLYSPNGRSATELWCCIYPASAPNKSFALQFALILNQNGAEFCCCLGAGTSQVTNVAAVNQNANALEQVRQALKSTSIETVNSMGVVVENEWDFRKQWRLPPGTKDFSNLSDWLAYAGSPTSSGASISKNLSVEEVVALGTGIAAEFKKYAALFKPLIEAAYVPGARHQSAPPSKTDFRTASPINAGRLQSAIRLFRWLYGEEGFKSPRYLEEERIYKIELSAEWKQIATTERFRATLNGSTPAEKLARELADTLCDPKRSNLLPWRYFNALKGDWTKERAETFLRATNALLFEGDRARPPVDEFNTAMAPYYGDKLSDVIKPASHCIPSLMLWLSDPNRQFFVRPGLYNRAHTTLTGAVAEGQGNIMTTAYYASAVQFAQTLAKELADNGLEPQDLIDVQGFLWGALRHSRVWFGGKSYGSTQDMFPEFLKRGVYGTNFADRVEVAKQFVDLPQLKKDERDRRRTALEKMLSTPSEQKAMTAFFDLTASPGDLVFAKSTFFSQKLNKSILRISGVGIARGGYTFESQIGHLVQVEWRSQPYYDAELVGPMYPKLAGTLTSLPIAEALDVIGSVITNDEPAPEEVLEAAARPEPNEPPTIERLTKVSEQKKQPAYTVDDFAKETRVSKEIVERWLSRARRKRQMILQGPPGTGKTFYAERLAKLLVADSIGITEVVQFHPSYAYEDFMQGIRPQITDGLLSYKVEPGRFLQFCERASKTDGAPCVLIIDEINRANLSRVFGELMYLLEYREKHAPLAAGGKAFTIPKNVYLVGTMNTADRSTALVDHALRRRFSFVYIEPDYEVLRSHLLDHGLPAESLVSTLKAINAAIDDRHYCLGISYFLTDGANLRFTLEDIWRGEIEPYLDEYFYDQEEKARAFHWDDLVSKTLTDWV